MKKLFNFRLLVLIGVLITSINQAWGTYYYRGDRNSSNGNWGATEMTQSEDGYYYYIYFAAGSAHQFKITDNDSWSGNEWTYDCVDKTGFDGSNITDIGDFNSTNAYCWYSGAHYILFYPKDYYAFHRDRTKATICASTSLPTKHDWYIKHCWGGGSWTWQTFTKPATGSDYTYEGQWGNADCNINTYAGDDYKGTIGKTSISGYSTFSSGDNVIFTYNPKTNSLSVSDKTYTVSVATSGNGTVDKASLTAGKYTASASVSASNNTGHHFTGWTMDDGVSIVAPATSSSTSVTIKATGASKTLTANFAANTYTVVYNANDAQYPGTTATGSTDNSSHTYGVAKKLTANGFARAGYSFAGWATTPTGTVAYSDQESVSNLTTSNGVTVYLYAKWSQEPRATLSVSDDTPNVGQSITFTGGGENCTPTAYQFFVDNVSKQSSATSTYSYTPTSTSTFAVKVIVTHAGGTVTSDVMNITPNTPSVALVSSSYAETKNTELTLTATPTNVQSGQTYQYYYSTNSGSTWTAIGSSTSSNTCAFTPTEAGTYKFKVVMSYYGSNYTGTAGTDAVIRETYTLKLKNSNGWVTNIHVWNTSDAEHPKQTYPGEDLATYGDPHGKWFTYIFDSKYNRCKVNSGDGNGIEFNVTADACMDIGWSGSAWTATSTDCPSAPTVTLSTTVRQNQITLKGQITDYGNDGSSASDMEEVGFYVGATKHAAVCDDGGYFYKTVTDLTANTQYSIYAFATNAGGTGVSATATPTTLATTATHKLKVQVPDGVAPYVYTYCDNDACGSNSLQNADFPGQAATRIIDGVSNDWYEFDIHDQYDKFVISSGDDGGEKQTNDLTNPKENFCRWYNNAPDDLHKGDRYGTTDCPVTATSLYYGDKNAATANHSYETMSGTTTAMSKTLSLAANHDYEFKIVYNAEYYGIASTTVNRDGKTNNVVSAGTSSAGAAYIYLKTDLAGDYTITFNETTKAVSVTYPEAYVMTYSKSIVGTDNSTTLAPSAAYSGPTAVASGDLVLDGTEVTFTAASAGTGYTWKGWYTKADPSDDYESDKVSTDDDLTYTVTVSDAAITVYAVYKEDMHTVTVNAGAHGSITTPAGSGSTVQAGIATTADIVTTNADYGYYFSGWTVEEGTAYFGDASAKSTTVRATTDATIKANYVSHWTIAGGNSADPDGADAMGDWNVYANGIEDFAQDASKDWIGHVDIYLPANTMFYFKVRDLDDGSAWYGNIGEMTYTNHTNWSMTLEAGNCRITTAGKGTYRFTWNETKKKLTVTYPTSYTVTYNVSTFYNEDASHDYDNTTGGSITYKKDNDSIELTSGKYVVAGGTMTFKATPASGYRFAGWYQNQACSTEYTDDSDGADIDDGVLTLTILDDENNKTVYAKFMENMTTVNFASTHGHVELSGETVTSATVGAVTTREITAVPAAGYYFSGWTKTECTDYDVAGLAEANATTTLSGLGGGETSGQTLTANFVELDKVYFRNWNEDSNGALWSDVYVYYNVTWSSNCVVVASDANLKAQMTQIAGTNVYWAYVPRSFTKNSQTNIAFSNQSYSASATFAGYEGADWGSYNKALNMFVPQHSNTKDGNPGGTTYYKGYWKNYGLAANSVAGYSIQRWKEDDSGYVDPADNGTGEKDFLVVNDNVITYPLRIDNTTSGWNKFKIYSAGGIKYITLGDGVPATGLDITTSNHTNVPMTQYDEGNPTFYISPSAEGIYTLIIDQSGDVMKLSVDFPISVGDYMLVHSYNDGSAKVTKSDVIKTSEIANRKYSMFIYNYSTPTLVLKKCTALSEGVPTWSSGTSVSMSGFKTDTAGVFVFDVSITNDNATLSNIATYKGDYYIKTDIASGGWTAYKENIMEANTITFDKAKPATFDHSYCHWIESTSKNIKCVIANDYNIAVSDTLVGDDILGTHYDAGKGKDVPTETLPASAYVRFSYNSTTNEVKRTYLSLTDGNTLQLEGNTLSSGSVSMIHDTSVGDGAAFTNNATNLTSLSNFTYSVDVKAREKARIRLTSMYQTYNQSLIGTFTSTGNNLDGASNENTVEILGGSTDNTGYKSMRIIYDFKTNHIMAAWLVDDDTNVDKDTALQADLMIIRQEQGDAYQLTFGTGKSMTDVKKVYGAMKFTKSFITNGSESPYERGLYWISFPFDVRLSDAFGMGTYGTHWIIEYYDGKERAHNGFWADSEGFWKYVTPYQRDSGFVMKANVGYVLALDLDELDDESLVWDNSMTEAYLYFPSKSDVGSIQIKDVDVTINQDGYQCTIGPRFEGGDDRRVKDSYWHIIGVPSYANVSHEKSDSDPVDLDKDSKDLWSPGSTLYFYEWNPEDNSYEIKSSSSYNFKAMHSYMVQYGASSLTWTNTNSGVPASVAARVEETTDYELKLSLLREDEEQDRTLLRMTNDVNATNRFEFNYDICKEYNGGRANIWTVTADTVEVAGNCLPTSTQTTVIPVGVKVVANGDYTFSIPDGTSGVNVTLVDTYANTRTSLSLIDYTTYLTTGTHEGRFLLEIAPISQMPTDLENAANANANANTNADAVRKVFVGGQLYIIRDGVIYNASGARVQ